MIAEPPSLAGAFQERATCALPAVAVRLVGIPGTDTGITEFDADDAELVPTAFVAVTVNVYAVPLVRPVTVIGDALPVPVIPPGLEVTV